MRTLDKIWQTFTINRKSNDMIYKKMPIAPVTFV